MMRGKQFAAEFVGTFVLLLIGLSAVVIAFSRDSPVPGHQPYTTAAAGAVVAFLVFVEAPLSGMSLNPSRSLGPAIVAPQLADAWVYLIAPPIGALVAVWLYRRSRATIKCGKLFHPNGYACQFLACRYTPASQRLHGEGP
jgi:aquaporin Z